MLTHQILRDADGKGAVIFSETALAVLKKEERVTAQDNNLQHAPFLQPKAHKDYYNCLYIQIYAPRYLPRDSLGQPSVIVFLILIACTSIVPTRSIASPQEKYQMLPEPSHSQIFSMLL
jgi:hypothetical protein